MFEIMNEGFLQQFNALEMDLMHSDWGFHMMDFGHMWSPGFLVWVVLMIIFWGLVIIGSVFLIKWIVQENNSSEKNDPMKILDKKFARGEIDEEEYEKRRDKLEGTGD